MIEKGKVQIHQEKKRKQVTPTKTGNRSKCFVNGKMSESYTGKMSCFSKWPTSNLFCLASLENYLYDMIRHIPIYDPPPPQSDRLVIESQVEKFVSYPFVIIEQ